MKYDQNGFDSDEYEFDPMITGAPADRSFAGLLAGIVFAIIVIGAVVFGFIPNASASTKYVLVQSELNVRSRASVGSQVYGRLYLGDSVEVERTYKDWSRLTNLPSEEGHGWVSSHYLVDDKVIDMNSTPAIIQSNGRVAVRKSVDGDRKCWLHPGDSVVVYGMSKTWSVTDAGYIKTEYLSIGN